MTVNTLEVSLAVFVGVFLLTFVIIASLRPHMLQSLGPDRRQTGQVNTARAVVAAIVVAGIVTAVVALIATTATF